MSETKSTTAPEISLRVLVAEDNRINRMMISECLRRKGHHTILAENGAQAVALFKLEQPDVVLLDIVMPGVDGLEAAQQIRALPSGETVPLIFLSAIEDEQAKISSLELADDFISKPIEPNLLMAKLSAFFRQVLLQRQLKEQISKTNQALELLEEETRMGAFVLNRVLKTTRQPDACVRYTVKPAVNFSGDLVLYECTPSGDHVVLLADAIGHGVAAAFNVFPLISVFTAMTRKGIALEETIQQMNRTLRNLMPIDRFVSMAIVSINPHTLNMQVWNGGLPAPLILGADGRAKYQFESTQLPLRLADDNEIDCTLVNHQLEPTDEILMFSDGLVEANHESSESGMARIQAMLWYEPEETRYDKLVATLNDPNSSLTFHDDVSLISIRISQMQTST